MTTSEINDLQKKVIIIFHYCQAHKGDLSLFNEWKLCDDAVKKLFFAYYSELFFRILFLLKSTFPNQTMYDNCVALIDKYKWYDIQNSDLLHSFVPEILNWKSVDYCEVPEALEYIDGLDDVIWSNTSFGKGRAGNGRAIIFAKDSLIWTFADVRGCIYRLLGKWEW